MPLDTATPDILARDSLLHDGRTVLLGPDFQCPDIIVRRKPVAAALLPEMLASDHGWMRDPSEPVENAGRLFCYLRVRYAGEVAEPATLRLFTADPLGCAPPRSEWTLLGERDVVLSPGKISYTDEPIEWTPKSPDAASDPLILEVETPRLPVLAERGSDMAAFHRDLTAHGGLRFKSCSSSRLGGERTATTRLGLRNFGDRPTPVRIRLVSGLPRGSSVRLAVPDVGQTEGAVCYRPEKFWLDATLPPGFDGTCEATVTLPADAATPCGYQLRTAYYHEALDHVIDGGAHNVLVH
jgi:hypothetical protein